MNPDIAKCFLVLKVLPEVECHEVLRKIVYKVCFYISKKYSARHYLVTSVYHPKDY